MAENFTPITTQEEFESAIKERIGREAKKYEGYTSPADLEKIKKDYDSQIASLTKDAEAKAKKYADYDKQLSERDAKIKGYESDSVKTRIAHEVGLPYELSGRLSGDTEDDIRKDAESLVGLIGKGHQTAPLASSETTEDKVKTAVKQLSEKLKK
ncbi:phage scaffold protein [Galactobacillus timonensis]|uniref:phage scaffold protein n=1 Tax=Galactobacillus timonensis TaxID=2041840 RepID=UPI000C81DDFB|nr:phage scaffold protein [Galactobacillus timonensis]